MTPPLSGPGLTRALRRALQYLYDPVELRHNPLPALLGMPPFDDPVAGLRGLLMETIAALRPVESVPANSNAQRYYDLLTYRFIEQMGQKEVASDMALSLRHLQRLESQALRALAEAMAASRRIVLDWNGDEADDEPDTPDQVQQEIDWLKKTYPLEKVELRELLRPARETLSPLFQAQSIHVRFDLPGDLPRVQAHIIPLQQAILHLSGLVAESFPGGTLIVQGMAQASSVGLTFSAESPRQKTAILSAELANGISLVRQVVEACGGTLDTTWEHSKFSGVLSLNAREQNPVVLVIDDNQDTLLLLERFLAHSPYTFVGANQPEQALPLLEQHRPAIVLLDVMLPETDGWSLLAQVKRHPLGNVPVVISTILPQEKLASMLGADAFIQKPFTARQLFDLFEKLGI